MKYTYLSDTIKIKKIEEKDNRGRFTIEGLYTGYGVTIANSLRRVLLSSLPGAAISQVRIKDVKHEFSTIPGMAEDIVEFSLNLKLVRFAFFAEEPQVMKLRVKGIRDVKAGDIESTPLVKVINPDLRLATLSNKKASLEMEVVVEKGLGYLPAEARHLERVPIGTVVLDSVFSPVTNVEFKVQNMRVGERTNYNKIDIVIETDGSTTPSRALHQAANILRDHYGKISSVAGGEDALESDNFEKSAGKKKIKKTTEKEKVKKPAKKVVKKIAKKTVEKNSKKK